MAAGVSLRIGRSESDIARATSALANAAAALATASRKLKYVTNWCFAPKGTETLAFMVRGWMEADPRRGVIADEVENMYNLTSRKCGFGFLRKRFPELLPVYRYSQFRALTNSHLNKRDREIFPKN